MKVKLLLSILLLAIIIAGSVLLTQEVLRVRAVVVLGCEQRSPQEVTALSGIPFGESIFKVDMDAVRENVQASPYYKVEKVSRLYPDKIEVVVHERRPRAVISYLGGMIVMDEAGYILEVRSELGGVRAPVVTGLLASSFVVGQQVSSSDPMQIRAMQAILEEMIEQECSQLFSEIAIDNVEDIYLMTVEGVKVQLGSIDNLSEKLRWVRATLPKLTEMSLVGGTLYVAGGSSPTWIPPEAGSEQQIDFNGWPEGQIPPEAGASASPEPESTEPPQTN